MFLPMVVDIVVLVTYRKFDSMGACSDSVHLLRASHASLRSHQQA